MRKAAVAAIISFGLLAGCMTDQEKRSSWIGHTEASLLSSWGGPERIMESGTVKYLTYEFRNGDGNRTTTNTVQINTMTSRVIRITCNSYAWIYPC